MPDRSIAHLRREYSHRALLEKNTPRNPFVLFKKWFKEALKAQALDANAFAVSTVSKSGRPSTRMVLLKGFESLGQLELGLLDREEEARCRAGREWATRWR